MAGIPMYHQGSRQLQDRHSTRTLADRLVEVLPPGDTESFNSHT